MNPQFEPLQPLISFVTDTPRLAWVGYGYHDCCLNWAETHWQVAITYDKNDIRYGTQVNVAKVKPFTPELWAACEEWMKRRQQLAADYEILKRNKRPRVASKSIPPWQDSLLEASR